MIAIVCEGGLVQAVVTDDPAQVGMKVLVIDYDTEGADEITCVRQEDGEDADACVHWDSVGLASIDLRRVQEDLADADQH